MLQVVDEAGFVKRQLIEELVLPVGFQKHVTTILVTTPGPPDSWFMQAVHVMHPDRPDQPIIPLRSAYKPCDACSKLAVPRLCQHVANKRAPTKDPARERVLRCLYRDDGRYVAESLGLSVAATNCCFNPDAALRMLQRTSRVLNVHPRYIIVGVDSAEGGHDQFALCAQCIVADGEWVVSAVFVCVVCGRRVQILFCCFFTPRNHCRCRCHQRRRTVQRRHESRQSENAARQSRPLACPCAVVLRARPS